MGFGRQHSRGGRRARRTLSVTIAERVARIEGALKDGLTSRVNDIDHRVSAIDRRLWGLLAMSIPILLGVIATLLTLSGAVK